MPCLCQYFAIKRGLRDDEVASLNVKDNSYSSEEGISSAAVLTGEVSASELAACQTEILSLRKELSKSKISSENMETLMKVMIEKQNYLITEIFELKRINECMKIQQINDRNNQALERGALLREMHEIRVLLQDRANVVKNTLQQNYALTHALKDANEKIYAMGIKYLKLKNYRFSKRDIKSSSEMTKDSSSAKSLDSSSDS